VRRRPHALRRRYGRAHRGEKLCPAGSKVQALLFPTERFSVAQAKAWASKHDWKSGDVDETHDFIHLRQDEPSSFRRIRTVFLGGRGVQARVGWPTC
jgi:hypothetical protein